MTTKEALLELIKLLREAHVSLPTGHTLGPYEQTRIADLERTLEASEECDL